MQLKTRACISLHEMKSAYRYLGITIRAALVLACMRIDEVVELEVIRVALGSKMVVQRLILSSICGSKQQLSTL